jgi:EpsI family protein
MSAVRVAIVVLVLLAAGLSTRPAATPGVAADSGLSRIPYELAGWRGEDAPPPDAETRRALAADEILTRTYVRPDVATVGLYVAYYAQQRPGVSVHSPLHCLPGTGWEPLEVTTIPLSDDGGAAAQARRMVVRKQRERALVLYWYSVGGRTIASELSSKVALLSDALRFRRGDASLIRVVVPLSGEDDAAERSATAFARDLLPFAQQLGTR